MANDEPNPSKARTFSIPNETQIAQQTTIANEQEITNEIGQQSEVGESWRRCPRQAWARARAKRHMVTPHYTSLFIIVQAFHNTLRACTYLTASKKDFLQWKFTTQCFFELWQVWLQLKLRLPNAAIWECLNALPTAGIDWDEEFVPVDFLHDINPGRHWRMRMEGWYHFHENIGAAASEIAAQPLTDETWGDVLVAAKAYCWARHLGFKHTSRTFRPAYERLKRGVIKTISGKDLPRAKEVKKQEKTTKPGKFYQEFIELPKVDEDRAELTERWVKAVEQIKEEPMWVEWARGTWPGAAEPAEPQPRSDSKLHDHAEAMTRKRRPEPDSVQDSAAESSQHVGSSSPSDESPKKRRHT